MAAEVTTQPRDRAVEGERDAAIRALAHFAARAAKEGSGEAAAVQEKDGLLALFQTGGDGSEKLFAQNGERLRLPRFLAEIDDPDERHLVVIHPQGQVEETILAAGGVVITLERRRGGAEKNDAVFHLAAHHGDIAGVVARRFFLFVGSLVFLIHYDEAEVFQRRENGAAGADHDPRAPGLNFMPLIMPLAFRKSAMQHRHHVLRVREATLETLHCLRRERDLGDEDDRGFAARQGGGDRL